jgi:YaiO family outer membrane protein
MKAHVKFRTVASFVFFCLSLAHAPRAAAQGGDVLASARDEATSGRRPAALARLSLHLESSPRDVDARLLYGAILSWEGRYDEARRELRQVLEQSPSYRDARIALMNVEWWSGNSNEARDAADAILAQDPGNQHAREVRDRLDAASHPWWAGVSYSNDTFNGSREAWHEYSASITRLTPRGSVIFRASEARRFGSDDRLIEVDFYPRFRPGTYAFISVGGAPDSTLYPSNRVAFDLYQAVGRGFEVSGGYRRLAFSSPTNIYVGTLSKYLGNWMLTGKVFHVPGEGRLDSTSYHGGFRRYVRGDGISYLGLTYSHGSSREEIRNVSDLATLESDTIRGEVEQLFAGRLRLFATGGTSRQEQQFGPLWQTSVTGGFRVLF